MMKRNEQVLTSVLYAVLLCCATGCATPGRVTESPGHSGAVGLAAAPPEATREMTTRRALLLLPVNVVPDILSNTLLYLFNPIVSLVQGQEPSGLWPFCMVTSPLLGPLCGFMDARAGYPFWQPVALDEHRSYAVPRRY